MTLSDLNRAESIKYLIEVESKFSGRYSGASLVKLKELIIQELKRVDGENYYLFSSKEEINYDVNTGNETKNIEVLNNLVTTNFNIQNYTYKESDVFKDKTLFNISNSILTDYWNVSGLTPTAKELEIINKIIKSF